MTEKSAQVLLVEDESGFVAAVRYQLQREGYEVRVAPDGLTALAAFQRSRPDLVLLDLTLPGMDGLEVCRRLRRDSDVPILILTARTGLSDKVDGLDLGADDYLTKPVQMRELVARVRAALRRARLSPRSEEAGVLEAGDVRIDLGRRAVSFGGREASLRAKEFELLTFLARHPGQVLSREQIMHHVWGDTNTADYRTIDVHIRWLREKLEEDPSHPRLLQTVRHAGYRLVDTTAGSAPRHNAADDHPTGTPDGRG